MSRVVEDLMGDIGVLLKDGTQAAFTIVDVVQLVDGRVLYIIDDEGIKIPWESIIYFRNFTVEEEKVDNNG